MDLVSEISFCNKICNAKSENTIDKYICRQEIAAYHHQLMYHENNLPTLKNADRLILGDPVKDSLENASNINSNIKSLKFNDEKQRMLRISPELPSRQQTNRRIKSSEHVIRNNIKIHSTNRDHRGMVTITDSPIAPLSCLQQSDRIIIDPEQASCSNNPRITLIDSLPNNGNIKYLLSHSPRENVGECKVAEKTTNCRPKVDLYSKQYINKTLQKNARLHVLVKRLALVREKEKQRLAWNTYINSLRKRHNKQSESRSSSDSIPEYTNLINLETVQDHTTGPACTKLRQSQNILGDYHSSLNDDPKNSQNHLSGRYPTFDYNGPNFTTNSQEHSMMLNFELPGYGYQTQILSPYGDPYHTIPRYDYSTTTPPTEAQIFLDETRHLSCNNQRPLPLKFINVNKSDMRNTSVQTKTSVVIADSERISLDKSSQEKYKQDNNSVDIIKKKLVLNEVEVKYSQLSTIDRKLDELIQSINNFISEIKSQKHFINVTNRREEFNQTKSSSFLGERNLNHEEIKCTMQDIAISNTSLSKENPQETLYTILTEEMLKSDQVKRDYKTIIKKPKISCSSLHITFDIPTKEGSMEIKDSFKVDARNVYVQEISEDKRMTVAVNTDPLGLLALFRVSAAAVKQLLSFVPSIDYYSYMSKLPLPTSKHMCHYVCNICGAAFDRPSLLSDHIQRHNLGRTTDCCICRHVLDSTRQSGLFTCRYCGQRFTRAYCRELHQLSCARALGQVPDDSSSHIILR